MIMVSVAIFLHNTHLKRVFFFFFLKDLTLKFCYFGESSAIKPVMSRVEPAGSWRQSSTSAAGSSFTKRPAKESNPAEAEVQVSSLPLRYR